MNSSAVRKIVRESVDIIWFVARGTVLKGPFTTEQLQEKLSAKEVSYLDFCWRQGFREWRPVGSVEDFDKRARLRSLPAYPTVELPCGPLGGEAAPAAKAPVEETLTRPKKPVQVSFAKSRRHSISIYEWGFAAIFGVVLAYFTAAFALNEVEHEVLRRTELQNIGQPTEVGEAEDAVSPSFWQPLFSAPGFETVMVDHAYPREGLPKLGTMPVAVDGVMRVVPGASGQADKVEVNGYEVVSPDVLENWNAAEHGLDPVYARPVTLEGYLSPKRPDRIEFKVPGDPRHF